TERMRMAAVLLEETERRSIARELHDEIGQSLTGLKLQLEALERAAADNAQALSHAKGARFIVDELMAQVRNLSLKLRPTILDDLGLLPALLWLFERYEGQTRIRVTFEHSGLEGRFAPAAETA